MFQPRNDSRYLFCPLSGVFGKIAALAALLLVSLPLAFAEELKLSQVIRSIRENHPILMAALEQRRVADAELLAARGAFDPSIKLESSSRATGYYEGSRLGGLIEQPLEFYGSRLFAGYRRSDGRVPIYEGMFETLEGGEFNAGIEVPLLRDGPIDRRRATIQRFAIEGDIADASIDEQLITLMRVGSQTYWQWIAAGERVKIFDGLLKVALERDAQISARVSLGDLPKFDQLDNQRQVLQRQSQLVEAERGLQQSAFELSLFLRDPDGNQIIPTKSSLPGKVRIPPPWSKAQEEEQIETAYRNRPELVKLERQRDQLKVERDLQENQMRPRLDLQLIASQDTGSGSPTLEEGELKAGVKVEIPLRVRTAEGRIQVADAKDRELRRLIEFQRQKIATDVRDALNALLLLRKRYELAKQEVKAAAELEQGERIRFEQGDSNLIFVNVREQTTAEAAAREVDAIRAYQQSLAAYWAILGLRYEEILALVQ
jgi:outer membrane protein TolC